MVALSSIYVAIPTVGSSKVISNPTFQFKTSLQRQKSITNHSLSHLSTRKIHFRKSKISLANNEPMGKQNSVLGALTHQLNPTSLRKDGIYFGFLPDEGDAGGRRQTMQQLNLAFGGRSAAYGWYAQVYNGSLFDGRQLLEVLEDVKACNCVFQPAVMPVGGWAGLTRSDNRQAIAIAQVMKKFTDHGIPVWLRFAHEMNYYQTVGPYTGTPEDFKEGWDVVAEACRLIAPTVKMWWSPNVASAENYAQYTPRNMSTVHLVGVDFYPKTPEAGAPFIETMKNFHDTYAAPERVFAIGETGLGFPGTTEDKLFWLHQLVSAMTEMNHALSISWFNYQKEHDYQLISLTNFTVNEPVKDFFWNNGPLKHNFTR
ncbi:hypothetical protein O181_026834 [Austropuccinia psidii MF-1]|uniref:GH26 domain-containing protein n=1 Tax=Austropuccinia psidii MF-1 TaxID=1389203 RepID=A0A9Q3H203_9BASI|nr:hypothetical protein [Austropuccinia psidii MF-1]